MPMPIISSTVYVNQVITLREITHICVYIHECTYQDFCWNFAKKTNEHTNVYFINKRTQNAMDKENKFNPNEIKEQKLIVNKCE